MRKWWLTILVAGALAGAAGRSHAAEEGAAPAAACLGSAEFRPSPERPAGWRADGSGRYPSADPITNWSASGNVLWRTEVGAGHSSPLVVGSRVLETAEPDLLVCLDAATGRELWRTAHKLSDLPAERNAQAPRQSEHFGDTTPRPVSDGKWVWVFFNTGIVACHDLEGNCRWRDWYDMRLATNYGRTAPPVLVGQRLLIHFGPLVCLEAATGKVLWENPNAKATYGTPATARIGDVGECKQSPFGHFRESDEHQLLLCAAERPDDHRQCDGLRTEAGAIRNIKHDRPDEYLLSLAGGPTPDGGLNDVKITRLVNTGSTLERKEIRMNLDDLPKVTSSELVLHPGDIVEVERTGWSKFRDVFGIVLSAAVLTSTVVTIINLTR